MLGQNLIPNHSFEKVLKVDNYFCPSYYVFNAKINGWSSPTQSSPDIIHEPFIEKMTSGPTSKIRENFFIKPLKPKSGKVFVGIKVYGCVPENTHCREYLQVKTLERLKIGQCYEYSYWTIPLTNGSRINNMGVAFSETKVEEILIEEVLDLGNRYGEEEIIKPGPGKWQQIKGIIKATSEWNYMVIGNFFHDFETDEIPYRDGYPWGYYLVDEVSLSPVNCNTGKPISKPIDLKKTVYFESNHSNLDDSQFKQLQNFLNQIRDMDYTSIDIIGHADEDGGSKFNRDLSLKRANNVALHIIEFGVIEDTLRISGDGEYKPKSQVDKSKNRRVEIVVVF